MQETEQLKLKSPEAKLLGFKFNEYDTAKPYGPSGVLIIILVAKSADSGSSPETYNRANHLKPTSWLGVQ